MSKRLEGGYLGPIPSAKGDPYFNKVTLLLHMNGSDNSTTFVDSSINNQTITTFGNAKISTTQSKFDGASGYFDGNGDYLRLSNTAGAISVDFTLEAWVRLSAMPTSDAWPTNWSNHMVVMTVGSASSGGGWHFIIGQTKLIFSNNDSQVLSGTHGMTTGIWYHLAICRSYDTLKLFVDGVEIASGTWTGTPSSGSYFWIGGETGEGAYLNGYIDELRVTNAARYTSNFTLQNIPHYDYGNAVTTGIWTPEQQMSRRRSFIWPSTGDVYFNNVSLLLNMDNSDGSTVFTDSSSNNRTVTAFGNAQISTTRSQFGTGSSGLFDGTGDYLNVTLSRFGTNNFTIETGIWLASLPGSYRVIFDNRISDVDGAGFTWGINSSGVLYTFTAGNFLLVSGTVTVGAWNSIALTRINGTWRHFINGVLQAGSYDSSVDLYRTSARIGMDWATLYGMNGNFDNFRITNGVGRYEINYNPPVAAWPSRY